MAVMAITPSLTTCSSAARSTTGTILQGRSAARNCPCDLALGGNAKLVFTNVNLPFRPYALAGATLHRFSLRVAKEKAQADEVTIKRYEKDYADSSGELGFDLGGGAMYRLQDVVDLVGEVRYRSLLNQDVDLAHFAVSGGVNYKM